VHGLLWAKQADERVGHHLYNHDAAG
jgi:hypothetical protein